MALQPGKQRAVRRRSSASTAAAQRRRSAGRLPGPPSTASGTEELGQALRPRRRLRGAPRVEHEHRARLLVVAGRERLDAAQQFAGRRRSFLLLFL
uniref:Uncharacterized protein n=1 Tax=Oryza punctata TaxID=4537 RepID=A0A0E0JUE0_ORYPU